MHNLTKFLFIINSTGFIILLPGCYGGRAIAKYIVKNNGFDDLLEREGMVMDDRKISNT